MHAKAERAPLKNRSMTATFSSRNGCMEVLELQRRRFGRWNDGPSRLVIEDGLRGRVFRDSDTALQCTLRETSRNGDPSVEARLRFPEADFRVRQTWTMRSDHLSWRVEISLKPGQPARTLHVRLLFPYPPDPYGLGVWSAQEQFPTRIERLGGLHLAYGDVCFGTVLPAVTLYREKQDVGLTVAKPFDQPTSFLSFAFQGYHEEGVELETRHLGLRPDRPAAVEFLVHPHAGCWRAGLGWLYRRYRRYFDPPNPKVRELDGGFAITMPFTEEQSLRKLEALGVRWTEIHNHFPYYGEYAPEAEEWDSVIGHDYPDAPPLPGRLSRGRINGHVRQLHRRGMRALLYFQCNGDAFIPYAEQRFPDAIARTANGSMIRTWKHCCLVSADPSTSFGKEMQAMTDRFLAAYPDIDGVFLDQLCYEAIDMAHDDGITMARNRPASRFGRAYEAPLRRLADALHRQGKLLFANGPYDVEVQRDVDGMMAEGTSWIAGVLQYLTLSKPLLVHTYAEDPAGVETMFRQCLLYGASYSAGGSSSQARIPPLTPETRKLFRDYRPLVDLFRGRTWLLEPHALKLPAGLKGNIFRAEDRTRILVSLVPDSPAARIARPPPEGRIEVRFRGMNAIRRVQCHRPGRAPPHPIGIRRIQNGLEVKIPEPMRPCVLVLS